MLMLGYSALLGVGLLLSAPWWLLRTASTRRDREGLRQRLGAVPPALRAQAAGRRVVWVHAVSVGEVLAVSRLVAELGTALKRNPGNAGTPWTVVVSTTTATGQALALERFGAARVFYFPVDFAWAVRAYLRALQPALLVLAESELWPRMLHECERFGVPVAVVNARVSDRSFRRALRVKRVWAPVLRKVTLWLAQSDEDARRLVSLGMVGNRVHVSGNLKYDVRPPRANRVAAVLARRLAGHPVIVAGSTVGHRKGERDVGEEHLLMHLWPAVLEALPTAVLVVAPRHPERFSVARSVLEKLGVVLASELLAEDKLEATEASGWPGERPRPIGSRTTVVLLDTIGDLASVYGIADVAFVGGSLVQKGGHNPLEPAQFGVPVVMGPSYENFRAIVRRMLDADGIRIVGDREALGTTLIELLQRPEEAAALGARGRSVCEREMGATERSVGELMAVLATSAAVGRREAVSA